MMSEPTASETRAREVADADFRKRVAWATSPYEVTVTAQPNGYEVAYLRQLQPGEPMIRGGGIDAGITYTITRTFEIAGFTLPR